MLNLNKEANTLQDNQVVLSKCPACDAYTTHMYYMQDSDTKAKSRWYTCSCGLVWQDKWRDFEYGQDWRSKNRPESIKFQRAEAYVASLYAPLIEEMIYGRKMLMVGYTPHQSSYLADRGWVSFTIDKDTSFRMSHRHIVGDFETFEFPDDAKYNLIWFYQTLESMKDPFQALVKARNLLAEDGILFIGTPDTDFLYTRGPSGFKHWKRDTNFVLWNRRALRTYLEKLGFDVVLARKNHDMRCAVSDDLHLLAQRKFY